MAAPMTRNIFFVFFPIIALIIGLLWFLKTPSSSFDQSSIRETAKTYNARIIRDNWGVAHIFGRTDPDTSFGLGYSHAEDDWETIQETIMTSRGMSAKYLGGKKNLVGLAAPVQDYLFDLFKVQEAVESKIASEVSPQARAMAKAYADGLNLWAIENPKRILPGILPVTDKDVIAGYTWATPFFYRMDEELQQVFAEGEAPPVGPYQSSSIHRDGAVLGSNAFAIAPSRAEDGHTRLVVNSHQPFVGPYAWFEAHVISEEGLNLAGGGFPGTPILAQGVTPTHGWAHTVNKPDLTDLFKLETERAWNPQKYKLDGEWVDFEISTSKFRVKLVGPFSFPVEMQMRWSVHGPVLDTGQGFYAIRFAGLQGVGALDQWYAMSKADNLQKWKEALDMNGVLSFNIVYANKDGDIMTIYNSRMPKRKTGPAWRGVLPGDDSSLIWDEFHSVSELPQIYNPESGWLFSANSSPFFVTDDGHNNLRENYPDTFGIETRMTNRAQRSLALFSNDGSISDQELLKYRADARYQPGTHIRDMQQKIAAMEFEDETLQEAQRRIKNWGGSAEVQDRRAAIAILTAMHAGGFELKDDLMPLEDAMKKASDDLIAVFGRLDPTWGEVNRLRRGDLDLSLRGGPDTLRAIYGDHNNFVANKGLTAVAGDTHIMIADWDGEGQLKVETIHQFGAATLDENSSHYADQAVLFADEKFKNMPMTLEEVLPLATRDYRPGQ